MCTFGPYPEEVVALVLQDYPALAVRRDAAHDFVALDKRKTYDSPLETMCGFYFEKDGNYRQYQNLDRFYALLRAYDRFATGSSQQLTETLPDHRPLHTFLSYVVNRYNLYDSDVNEFNSYGFPNIIRAMFDNDPTQFGERDSQGRLPLNVLVESRCPPQLNQELIEMMVKILVMSHPRAASSCNREGRLPLHLAVENGWPFKPIMEAAMQAVSTKDVLTRMYPFQLAALPILGHDDSNEEAPDLWLIDASYSLLRQNPMLVCSSSNVLYIGATRKRTRKKSKTRC